MRKPCLASLASLFFVSVSPSSAQEARLPVIDMHLHAFSEIFAERRLCFPQPCESPPARVTSNDQLLPEALAEMDRYNVVLAVVSGALPDVQEWVRGREDQFVPGLLMWRPEEHSLDDVRSLLASGEIRVLGELAFQYEGIAIDDASVDPLLKLAHELDVPVHVHVEGLGGSPDFPVHLGSPMRVAAVLRKYPGLRIYLENAGWPFLEEVTSLMYQYPSVYADISTILHLTPRDVAYRYLERLIENGLGKRLMFGSDQMVWPEVIGENIEAINSADFLSQEQKRDILYNNAARFLRLSKEQIAAHHQD